MQTTIENLIGLGVQSLQEKGKILFSATGLKNTFKTAKFNKADVVVKVLDEKEQHFIAFEDIKELSGLIENIKVEEVEIVSDPCDKDCKNNCGCTMTQEEAEATQNLYEELDTKLQELITKGGKGAKFTALKKALKQDIEVKQKAIENYLD
jgi:hypothetical protein